MRLLFRLLLPLLALPCLLPATAVRPALAGPVDVLPEAAALRERLGTPADPAAVEVLEPLARGTPPAVRERWARSLGEAGGMATWGPLLRLTRDNAPEVRLAALEGLGRSGAWAGAAEARLAEVAGGVAPAEAVAALEALARVGTAACMPVLLGQAAGDQPARREAALEALRRITGLERGGNAGRWAAWWRVAAPGLRRRLEASLEVATEIPTSPAAERAVQTAIGLAWAAPDRAEEVLGRWLDGWDAHLHRHAAVLLRERPLAGALDAARRRARAARAGTPAAGALVETLRVLGAPIAP